MGLLAQYDPRLNVSPSRPVYLQPGGAGPLGNGRSGPFAPGANAYGVRVVASLSGPSAMPYADGWKLALMAPFSDEAPCGLTPKLARESTGVFAELFRRSGVASYGGNAFVGRDGRRYYGAVGQLKAHKLFIEGGAAVATFLGDQTRLGSIAFTYVPTFDKAFSVRIDDQDGFVNYVPCASWLLPTPRSAVLLVVESTITQGVAPTTTVLAEVKF